jgi:hypothetical protein
LKRKLKDSKEILAENPNDKKVIEKYLDAEKNLENLIGSQCPLDGEDFVDLIKLPFISQINEEIPQFNNDYFFIDDEKIKKNNFKNLFNTSKKNFL